jgi:hypothetical protein
MVAIEFLVVYENMSTPKSISEKLYVHFSLALLSIFTFFESHLDAPTHTMIKA